MIQARTIRSGFLFVAQIISTLLLIFSAENTPIMNRLFLIVLLFVALQVQAQSNLPLIPIPEKVISSKGFFQLKSNTKIYAAGSAISVAQQFMEALKIPTGYQLALSSNAVASTIHFEILKQYDASIAQEGYHLQVTPASIHIKANQAAGLFYGMQTLLQLFPKEIESPQLVQVKWQAPCVSISDKPRFSWRGLMLDVSRHFFTKAEVKQFINEMVRYKYNLLHLHLTDDQGWRLAIESLPELTKIGAWRPKREGKWGNTTTPDPNEPKTYGGFYTADDIREIVAYAKERFVNIMPEIDVPGHSMAAIASYPYLTVTPGSYQVNAGDQFMVWEGNGHFYALKDNNLNPASEKTYAFLDKVFTEVAKLFPFEYIHMGGDECAKNLWEKSDTIKSFMKRNGIQTMDQLQSYFVTRVGKIIQSKGKKMIGWDEILEGGLTPDAAVMSWRGMKGGIAAAKEKHKVVMSPTDYAYLDYYQGEPTVEPPVYAGLRLNKTYQFDPMPPGVDPAYILGGQGNLWSEKIPNYRTLQYMTWPRGLAIAESVWSMPTKRNWEQFVARVEQHFERMDVGHIKYAKSVYDPIITAQKDAQGNLFLVIEKEISNLNVHFSLDETPPDPSYPIYTQPVLLPKDVANVKLISSRNGEILGKEIKLSVEEFQKRIKP